MKKAQTFSCLEFIKGLWVVLGVEVAGRYKYTWEDLDDPEIAENIVPIIERRFKILTGMHFGEAYREARKIDGCS
jgi:hypothetical protein